MSDTIKYQGNMIDLYLANFAFSKPKWYSVAAKKIYMTHATVQFQVIYLYFSEYVQFLFLFRIFFLKFPFFCMLQISDNYTLKERGCSRNSHQHNFGSSTTKIRTTLTLVPIQHTTHVTKVLQKWCLLAHQYCCKNRIYINIKINSLRRTLYRQIICDLCIVFKLTYLVWGNKNLTFEIYINNSK